MHRKIAGHSKSKEFSSPRYINGDVVCVVVKASVLFIVSYLVGKAQKFTCLPLAEGFFEPEGPNILLMLAHCGIMFLLHGSLTHKRFFAFP